MNEQILELARQVWPDPNVSHVNHTKFAELIIKDCISQIAIIGLSNEENEDISWAVDLAILNIKDRFGVK